MIGSGLRGDRLTFAVEVSCSEILHLCRTLCLCVTAKEFDKDLQQKVKEALLPVKSYLPHMRELTDEALSLVTLMNARLQAGSNENDAGL